MRLIKNFKINCMVFFLCSLYGLSAQTLDYQNNHLLKVGMNRDDSIARLMFEKVCMAFEALHPKNICKEFYLPSTESVLDALGTQEIDLGALPEYMILDDAQKAKKIQIILPIYQKSFTLIAHLNGDIHRLADLQQKKIGFIKNNQDDFKSAEVFLSKLGVKNRNNWSFYTSHESLVTQFCDNRIDAILMSVIHPDRVIRELTTACDGVILPISSQLIDRMIKEVYSYGFYEIKPNYWRMNKPIPTVSTRTLLLSSGRLPMQALDELMANFWNEIKESKSFMLFITSINQSFNQGKISLIPAGDSIMSKIRAIKADFSKSN